MPLGLALLSAAFPPERRGAAIGIFSAITGLAVASGPLVGGAVVEGLAGSGSSGSTSRSGCSRSRSCSPRCARATAPTPASTSAASRSSPAARSGSSGGWCAATRPAGAAPRWSARSLLGALLVAAFVAWELRAREPMLPMGFFRSRAFSAGNAAIFFTFASLFGAVFFYAQLLQTGLGYGPLGAGLRLLPWTATFMTVAPVAGALADRIGERPLMVARADAAGGRAGLAGADRRARHGLLADARAVHRRRRRRLDGDPGRAELGPRIGGRRARSARRRAPTA